MDGQLDVAQSLDGGIASVGAAVTVHLDNRPDTFRRPWGGNGGELREVVPPLVAPEPRGGGVVPAGDVVLVPPAGVVVVLVPPAAGSGDSPAPLSPPITR